MTSLFWYVNVNIGSRFTFSRGKQFTILVLEHRLKTPTRRRLHCKRCFSYPLYFANRPSICKNSGDPQTNRSLSGASIQLFRAQQSNYFWLQPHSLGVKQFPDSFCLVVTQKKTTWFYFQRGNDKCDNPKKWFVPISCPSLYPSLYPISICVCLNIGYPQIDGQKHYFPDHSKTISGSNQPCQIDLKSSHQISPWHHDI